MADLDNVLLHLKSVWSAMTVDLPQLEQLPTNLSNSAIKFYNQLILPNSIPSTDWPLLSPTKPIIIVKDSQLIRITEFIKQNKIAVTIVLGSITTTAIYYSIPLLTQSPLKPFIPILFLPKSNRPIRIISLNSEIRREAILILGVNDNPLLIDLVLSLEKAGFVVICTVNKSFLVEQIERKSKGYIKVLVLDDTDSTSVSPFLISFLTAISLRFPLNSSGDPYSRPANALNLTGIINGFSLNNQTTLTPVEIIQPIQIQKIINERITTLIGVLNGVLPVIRIVSERPKAEECVIINLVSSTTGNIALPFQALASASDAAIISLLTSLSRELALSKSSNNIRVTILEVGFFKASTPLPPSSSPPTVSASGGNGLQLNSRLNSLYAPALARRSFLLTPKEGEGAIGATGNGLGRKSSCGKILNERILEIIIYGRGGRRSRIGAGANTYRFAALLPTICIDKFLILQDNLIELVFKQRTTNPLTSTTINPNPVPNKEFKSSLSSSTTSLFPLSTSSKEVLGEGESRYNSERDEGESSNEEMDDLLSASENLGRAEKGSFSFVGSEVDWEGTQ